MTFRTHLDIDTPLGRVWMRAASVHQSLLSSVHQEMDPNVRDFLITLAHGQKVLCEIVEAIQFTQENRR